MSILFEPCKISSLIIKNRFVRSATHDNTADNGFVTDKTLKIYSRLAKSQIGLIISGHMYVDLAGIPSFGMLGIDSDDKIEGLERLTDAVHSQGGVVFAQLNHGGRNTRPDLAKGDIVAPSAVPHRVFRNTPRELKKDEIQELAKTFAKAAKRAKECGFDGVQFHAAHGYLISQFHSPFTNKRTDEYGGSIENRTRFLKEILIETRKLVGKEFPLTIKLNSQDFVLDGFTVEDSSYLVSKAEELGLDAVEVSGGVMESQSKITRKKIEDENHEAYFREAALKYKSLTGIPIMLVGGFRTLRVMEKLLYSGGADFVSMCRPFIVEPDLVLKFMENEKEKSDCISCAKCMNPENSHLQCVKV